MSHQLCLYFRTAHTTTTTNTWTTTDATHLARLKERDVAIPPCTLYICITELTLDISRFPSSVISKACSHLVVPATTFITTTATTATTTINLVSTFSQTTTTTATTTESFTTTVTDTVDLAVFQQIDVGENCPGFGGSVTPITAVSADSIDTCIQACFSLIPFLLKCILTNRYCWLHSSGRVHFW